MTSEFDRSKKLDTLANWAEAQGITIESCEIRAGSNGAGLYATRDVAAGDNLVTVPYHKVLSRDTVVEYAQTHEFLRSLLLRDAAGAPISEAELTGVSDKDVLTRFFISEILTNRRGDASNNNWAAWVESLPALREMNLPIAWDRQDIEDLAGTSIYDATLSKINFLKFRYKRFFESIEVRNLIKEYVTTGPAPKLRTESDVELAFKDWVLIESWISSRSLEVFYRDQRELCLGLVPVVDMANHDSVHSNAKYELDFDGKVVSLVSTTTIAANTEVLIDYGEDKGAGEFVFSYGFIPATFNDAVVANFIIPDLLGDEEESEGAGPADESDELTVLRAKDKMFGTVPRLLRVKADGTWTSDYLSFLALPAGEFSFGGSDGTEVEFRGASVGALRAGGAQAVAENDAAVMERAASMADSLVVDVLRPELEQDAAPVPSTGGAGVAGRLAELERLLLAKIKTSGAR
ncbi:hypothetical protein D0Z00_002068 [Geotrichum galactomycetum]|uniref:Uncharacterized protein n=1 Tax=Geotrichum galactomycetum TaxID=27317 RepID=A0ACB6V579_9ASCO|nr:hypothetical protein D0Z00_002068 [Geotrichum candidum]